MQRFKSAHPRSVFSTSIPPSTTPSTINDISALRIFRAEAVARWQDAVAVA